MYGFNWKLSLPGRLFTEVESYSALVPNSKLRCSALVFCLVSTPYIMGFHLLIDKERRNFSLGKSLHLAARRSPICAHFAISILVSGIIMNSASTENGWAYFSSVLTAAHIHQATALARSGHGYPRVTGCSVQMHAKTII